MEIKDFKGEIESDVKTLTTYSHDASLFEVRPQVVVFPKDVEDVKTLVRYVSERKKIDPTISLTARAAGTDMSGGPLNTSIIADFTRHLNKIRSVTDELGVVEPGCYYRDFEKETLKKDRLMPAYTASKDLCAVGGMVANNSGGEKTLKYGKTENYLAYLKVVLSDGNEYLLKPLTKSELEVKCEQSDFEGELYKKLSDLIFNNLAVIKAAKPNVSKNSAGYYLWNVWNDSTQTFDLNRLIVGSQGTLGLVTEIGFKLVPTTPHTGLLVIFMDSLDRLPELVNELVAFGPESLESYDDYSLKLAIKFFFDFFQQVGLVKTISLGWQFLPEVWHLLFNQVPKLTVIAEIAGQDEAEVTTKLRHIQQKISHFNFYTRLADKDREEDKYWEIRHQSFNLLRHHVRGRRTAPFIDDVVVRPADLPKFLPALKKILDGHKLIYTMAGHAGDGNFHIIPLMDLKAPYSADQIIKISDQVYGLVKSYHGSITAEHNDGIIRTPYLSTMYRPEVLKLFVEVKKIFDPANIFNPGKKVGGTVGDIRAKLVRYN